MSIDIKTTAGTREAWLAERNRPDYIGASEVAAALGEDRYKSPFTLWAEKTGKIPPDDLSDNEAVEFGLRLEPVILESFAKRTGRECELWTPYKIARHRDFTWFGTTPDSWQNALPIEIERFEWMDGVGLCQMKNVGEFGGKDWWDGPPARVQIQIQAELAVMNLNWSTALALIGGNKLRWWDIQRDDDFIEAMLVKLCEFRERIVNDDPPGVDDSESCSRTLDKLYPRGMAEGREIKLPDEFVPLDIELQSLKAQAKETESKIDLIKNQIKSGIGAAEIGRLSSGAAYRLSQINKPEHSVKASSYPMLRRMGK